MPTLWELDQQFTNLGIRENESIEEYHGGPGLSFSGLKHFSKTPLHYFESKRRKEKETQAQRVGTIMHMAILEPERFEKEVRAVDGNRTRIAIREQIEALENDGFYVCKPEELDAAQRVQERVEKNINARRLISHGRAEVSVRVRHPETGVLLKVRPDYLRSDGVIVDVKTFTDLSERNVQRQIFRMKYHWQSALYLTVCNLALGTNNSMFAHLFVDTETNDVRIFVIDDASLEKAAQDIHPLIHNYSDCLKNDEWPGWYAEIVTTALPSYGWSDYE